jgi:pimeloyl-ACP methyl ester carboxylesterase
MSMLSPPTRPPAWEERAASFLLHLLGPKLPRPAPPPPPRNLAPFEPVAIPRHGRGGALAATWYPAKRARGAVLLVHPWIEWGQAYFHRRGRIAALRQAGYHALSFDLSGFGGSAPPEGFFDRDVEDALAALRERAGGVPVHLWGISAGGCWSHAALSRNGGLGGAVFEDVSPHLLEWSSHTAPRFNAAYTAFRRLLPRAHRFLDLRRHAPALHARAVAYVSGERDQGVPPGDTRELARLAGGECLIVPEAPHLAAIKLAAAEVIGLALRTFERGT